MERVEGLGGFFFKAKEPKVLAQWYADHLGITPTPHRLRRGTVAADGGADSVRAVCGHDRKYFGRAEQAFMLNFRVRSLDAMVAQLRRAGITVEVDPETYPNGLFARAGRSRGQSDSVVAAGGEGAVRMGAGDLGLGARMLARAV